jgi:hypothetical protein
MWQCKINNPTAHLKIKQQEEWAYYTAECLTIRQFWPKTAGRLTLLYGQNGPKTGWQSGLLYG